MVSVVLECAVAGAEGDAELLAVCHPGGVLWIGHFRRVVNVRQEDVHRWTLRLMIIIFPALHSA